MTFERSRPQPSYAGTFSLQASICITRRQAHIPLMYCLFIIIIHTPYFSLSPTIASKAQLHSPILFHVSATNLLDYKQGGMYHYKLKCCMSTTGTVPMSFRDTPPPFRRWLLIDSKYIHVLALRQTLSVDLLAMLCITILFLFWAQEDSEIIPSQNFPWSVLLSSHDSFYLSTVASLLCRVASIHKSDGATFHTLSSIANYKLLI